MKLKKRKIKYTSIFLVCWFALLVFLVDGVLKFQTLVDYFGSYALVEITLLLLVILPTIAVYKLTKEDNTMSKRDYIQANKDWLEAKSKERGFRLFLKEYIIRFWQRVTLRVPSRRYAASSQPTTQERPSTANSLTVAVAECLWLVGSVTSLRAGSLPSSRCILVTSGSCISRQRWDMASSLSLASLAAQRLSLK